MPTEPAPARAAADRRTWIVANVLLIALAVMIIMDIFSRRRAASARSLSA